MPDAGLGRVRVSAPRPVGDARHVTDEAFEQLIREHGPRIASICRTLLNSEMDAQDAAQETFARYLRVVPEITGDVAPFLNTVARNICRDELRRRRGRQAVPVDAHDLRGAAPGPEATVLQRQTLHALWEDLTDTDRRLLSHRILGFRCAEIAHRLGVSVSTVTAGLSRAHRRAHQAVVAADADANLEGQAAQANVPQGGSRAAKKPA